MSDPKTKCGFVAVIGEPNSGKSTLINCMVGEKVSIVSHKVQTTRCRVRAISQHNDCLTQIVFVDTPGFFVAKTDLEKALVTNFRHAYKDSDVILVVIDARRKTVPITLSFLEKLKDRKVAAVINKIDIASKSNILSIASELSKYSFLEKVFMISASGGDGVPDIVEYLKNNMPERPYMFDSDSKTDMSMQFRLAEITREKLYQILLEELPYSIYVETELFKETEKKVKIYQAIIVAKDSQKGIVLGRGGDRIKAVKDRAISDIKGLLGKKVELKLFVKVKENWTKKRTHLQNAGIINH